MKKLALIVAVAFAALITVGHAPEAHAWKLFGGKAKSSSSVSGGHSNGARPSTKDKHEKGDARRSKDQKGEKGDKNRSDRSGKRR